MAFDPDGELWGYDRPQTLDLMTRAALLSLGESGDAAFYSPDQPRDYHGRWTSGGGGGGGGGRVGMTAGERRAGRDMAREHVRAFLAGKSPVSSSAERDLLARHLATLTVPELHDLRREHGLTGSRLRKAELVAKLAGQMHALREARARAEGTPAPAPPPKAGTFDRAAVERDVLALARPDARTGLPPLIPALYDRLKGAHPGLSEADFHGVLHGLAARDLGTLQTSNDPRLLKSEGYPHERYPRHGKYGGVAAWFRARDNERRRRR